MPFGMENILYKKLQIKSGYQLNMVDAPENVTDM